MQRLRTIPIFLCLAALSLSGMAQRVKASAELDTNAIKIGEQFRLKLSIEQPANMEVAWPRWSDTVTKGVEIVEIGEVDTGRSHGAGQVTFVRNYVLTVFDSGSYTIPPIGFAGGPGNMVYTKPLFVTVISPEVDTTKGIHDIKGPVEVPFNWREYLPYILGAMGAVIVLIGIIYLIVYLVRKRRAKIAARPQPVVPAIPAHVIALEALRQLGQRQLWQQGMVKQYHSELTDILRDYLKAVYAIDAPEMITDDIVRQLKLKDLSNEHRNVVRNVLELADMVKFAKVAASDKENEQVFASVTAFVHETSARELTERAGQEKKGGGDAR